MSLPDPSEFNKLPRLEWYLVDDDDDEEEPEPSLKTQIGHQLRKIHAFSNRALASFEKTQK